MRKVSRNKTFLFHKPKINNQIIAHIIMNENQNNAHAVSIENEE